MIKNYIKLAFRNIRKSAFFSLTNIGSLAIAIAAVILILLWIEKELSFDKYHKNGKSVYLIKSYESTDNQLWVEENSPYTLGKAIQDQVPAVSIVTQLQRSQENAIVLKINNNLYQQNRVFYIDSNWFKVFDYKFLQGNPAYFFSYPYSIIMTESKAKEIFGTINIVGQTLQIDTMSYRIGGIIEDNPSNSSFQFSVLMPMASILDTKDRIDNANYWPYSICKTFIKIDNNYEVSRCETLINKLYTLNSKKNNVKFQLLPLQAMHFSDDFTYTSFNHGSYKSIIIFFVLGILLMAIACINYVNLSIAMLSNRLKEITVRKIAGAKPIQLFLQVITESFVTTLLSLFLAITLLAFCMPLLRLSLGVNFEFDIRNWQLWITLLAIFVFIIIAAGIYPAVLLNSIKPNNFFKGANILDLKNSAFKKILLTIQFSMAIFMIIATIVVRNQLAFIENSHSHLDAKALYTVEIPQKYYNMDSAKLDGILENVKAELLASSSIKAISRTDESSVVNFAGQTSGGLNWSEKPVNFQPTYVSFSVEPSIKNMLGLSVIQGRWFDENRIVDKNNIILNETAVKEFNLKEPVLGKHFNHGVIIGVVKDFMFQSMRVKISPVVIRVGKPRISNMLIEANSDRIKQSLDVVKTAWNRNFPGQFCNVNFLQDELKELYMEDQRAYDFTKILSLLAIVLCCAGLLGMTVFMINNRKKEIGIRKLLGASFSGILLLMSKEFVQLVLISIIISSPIAWYAMNKWLQNYAYRIDIGLITFFIAGLLSLLITLFTIAIIVLKSANGSQIKNLRSE